ncbi:MAG TPA: NAD(P)/FAD-dependent oxidoreductase [Candidatus Bathyarchaeia archaeon]|nr:NAD(P)/FAD-dependent oxidoreductase [Candidatus Bathyarchaeia archaeon]
MEEFDVAVIGAGPAGVMAAWKAVQQGSRTILLERESNPGKKVCAEGVLGDVLSDAEIRPQPEFAINKIDGALLYGPDESKRVTVKGDGYILDKPALLNVLAKRAEDAGAEVRYGIAVSDLRRENDGVRIEAKSEGQPFTFDARIVIGCDGTGSVVARRFFQRPNYQVIAAFQYNVVDCNVHDESKLEIFVGQNKAPAGYIWIFPKTKHTANVGIGLKGTGAKRLLDIFIENHPDTFSGSSIERSLAAPVPVGGEVDNYVADNLMLCGDAAGQVIPLTGAGIHTGLVSGKIAGEVAGAAAKEGELKSKRLSEYKNRFQALFGERISTSLKALESFERFSDEELNIITQYLDGQDLVEMANGVNPSKAIRLLVRHPLLGVKVAYQLLTS